MRKNEQRQAYTTPLTDVLELQLEQCIAQSQGDGGLGAFENNDLLDELSGIL